MLLDITHGFSFFEAFFQIVGEAVHHQKDLWVDRLSLQVLHPLSYKVVLAIY